MAKEVIDKKVEDIRKFLGSDRLIFGTEETIKAIRSGKLEKIYLTSNCKESSKEDIERFAGMAGVEIVALSQPNDELGALCKKPFSISVVGVVKA